jgi:hypothetical protein
MAATVYIAGDFDITQSSASSRPKVLLNSSSAALTGTVVIEGTLKGAVGSVGSNYAFDLPANGLVGQIVIINSQSDAHPWSAPVKVGSIILDDAAGSPDTAPYYTRPSTPDLGGGAVGVVPFQLYAADCDPPPSEEACDLSINRQTWPDSSFRQTIILRHYGPVYNAGYPTCPLVIWRESVALCAGNPDPCPSDEPDWVDRTSLFDVYVPGDGSREVWVAYKLSGTTPVDFTNEYKFDIDLLSSGGFTLLRSDGTFPYPQGVAGYPYLLYPICPPAPPPGQGE